MFLSEGLRHKISHLLSALTFLPNWRVSKSQQESPLKTYQLNHSVSVIVQAPLILKLEYNVNFFKLNIDFFRLITGHQGSLVTYVLWFYVKS